MTTDRTPPPPPRVYLPDGAQLELPFMGEPHLPHVVTCDAVVSAGMTSPKNTTSPSSTRLAAQVIATANAITGLELKGQGDHATISLAALARFVLEREASKPAPKGKVPKAKPKKPTSKPAKPKPFKVPPRDPRGHRRGHVEGLYQEILARFEPGLKVAAADLYDLWKVKSEAQAELPSWLKDFCDSGTIGKEGAGPGMRYFLLEKAASE